MPGGLIRSEHMEGVLYEPHGSHIFHTEDQEVWELANAMTPFNDYRHRVDISVEGKILNWPILLSDIDAQSRGDEIKARAQRARGRRRRARARRPPNFEEWCLELMGPILYERYIRPYTEKQWGRPARELSAQWAPRRVSVRWDNDPYLFPDPYQGWPAGPNGYTDLHRRPARPTRVSASATASTRRWTTSTSTSRDAEADLVILTCPLDVFAGEPFGRAGLARDPRARRCTSRTWTTRRARWSSTTPATEFPFIRIHETKHASRQECEGTVLGFEFTSAPTRYYPIELPENRALNDRYHDHSCASRSGAERTYFAGRLANYVYIDMDDCMRQALDAAEGEVLPALGQRVR